MIIAEDGLKRGKELLTQHDYDAAIIELTQAIQSNPIFAPLYLNRGLAYEAKAEIKKAVADFKTVLFMSQDSDLRWVAEQQLKNLSQEATAAAAEPLSLDELAPAEATSSPLLAGESALAPVRPIEIEAVEEGEREAPAPALNSLELPSPPPPKPLTFIETHLNCGHAYLQQSEYDQAIAEYTQVIQQRSDLAEAYYCRAMAYLGRDALKAIADLTQVVALRPGYADAYLHRGRSYELLRELGLAIADYKTLLALNDGPKLTQVAQALVNLLESATSEPEVLEADLPPEEVFHLTEPPSWLTELSEDRTLFEGPLLAVQTEDQVGPPSADVAPSLSSELAPQEQEIVPQKPVAAATLSPAKALEPGFFEMTPWRWISSGILVMEIGILIYLLSALLPR